MRIENLSKEVDMTAVHGAGAQAVGIFTGGAASFGGLISANSVNTMIGVQQGQASDVNNTAVDLAGLLCFNAATLS